MRFLSDQPSTETATVKTEHSEKEIEISVHVVPVNVKQQTEILRFVGMRTAQAKVDGSGYCLKNVISKLVVNGEGFEGDALKKIADAADVSDEETRAVMFNVLGIVANAICMKEEDAKKS